MCESFFETLCLDTLDTAYPVWGVLLEVCIFLYAFAGLAIVCDEYLVVSLETLCVRFNIREDIAGASFMAFGSAAPEIIINAVATIQSATSKNADFAATNLGVSAIIGSGLIAFTAIPGMCGLFARETLELKRRPLLRDFVAYMAALGFLVYAFSDGKIVTWEAGVMLGVYVVYLTVLASSPRVRTWYRRRYLGKRMLTKRPSFVIRKRDSARASALASQTGSLVMPLGGDGAQEDGQVIGPSETTPLGLPSPAPLPTPTPVGEDPDPMGMGDKSRLGVALSYASVDHHPARPGPDYRQLHEAAGEQPSGSSRTHGFAVVEAGAGAAPPGSEDDGSAAEGEPASPLMRALALPLVPLRAAFAATCPECHYESAHAGRYPVTFLASFIWVAAFSITISSVVSRWVDLSGVSAVLFGILLVAIGAEIPDMVQSVTVARRGYGSMAVGNAIGSQIINVLVGLGLPWFISNVAAARPVQVSLHKFLRTAALFQFGNIGMALTLLLLHTFALRRNKVQLDSRKGALLLATYLGVVAGYVAYVMTRSGSPASA